MIDVRELRVGNLLMKEGILVTIDARSIFDIWDKSEKYEHIPLIEEWLIKFQFKKHSHYIGIAYKYNDFIVWLDNGKWRKADAEEYKSEGRELDYVHQIQNLYFALYREELNVNQ